MQDLCMMLVLFFAKCKPRSTMQKSKDDEKGVPTTRTVTPSIGGDDIDEMSAIEPIHTNNVRPACFKNTAQEILFVLTATMAIGMTSFLIGSVTVISSFVGKSLVASRRIQRAELTIFSD